MVKPLVPKLRFPQFVAEPGWETCPLQEIAERVTKKNSDGRVTRVLTNSAEQGVLDQRDYFDRDIASAGKLDGYCVVDIGDYVYNPRTSAVAPVGPISRNNVGKGVMSPLYTVFRFASADTDFYEHYFRSSGWHAYLRSASSTGARHDRMSITNDAFMQMPLPVPAPAEQRKIAECLTSLGELITAETRKLEALRTFKKGLMQNLFPREGETTPRLRFPEFRTAPKWEARPFGEAAVFYNGRAYAKEELLKNGKYKVLRVGNFFTNKEWYFSDLELEESKYCDDGDLLYAWSASFGPRRWAGGKVIFHYHIWKVVEATDVDRGFLHLALEIETDRMRARMANGTGMFHITKGTIESWVTKLPGPAEQQRITTCLSSLDALITAQTDKIAAFKRHKQGLMQSLFPSLEGD